MDQNLLPGLCRELKNTYDVFRNRELGPGDWYYPLAGGPARLLSEGDLPGEGALFCPSCKDLLQMAGPLRDGPFVLELGGDEWTARDGEGRTQRQGRGNTPEEALAAWLIARIKPVF